MKSIAAQPLSPSPDQSARNTEPSDQERALMHAYAEGRKDEREANREQAAGELLCEHSGCGRGPQRNQISFSLMPGETVVKLPALRKESR